MGVEELALTKFCKAIPFWTLENALVQYIMCYNVLVFIIDLHAKKEKQIVQPGFDQILKIFKRRSCENVEERKFRRRRTKK